MTARGAAQRTYDRLLATETDDCLLWPHSLNTPGYGQLGLGNKVVGQVHVLACEHHHGLRPEGMQVAHSCGNRPCMNGRHLRWATPVENAADRVEHGTDLRGEKSPAARLTEAQVHAIRHAHTLGITAVTLAAEYGVARRTINSIWQRKSWAWMPEYVDDASAAA